MSLSITKNKTKQKVICCYWPPCWIMKVLRCSLRTRTPIGSTQSSAARNFKMAVACKVHVWRFISSESMSVDVRLPKKRKKIESLVGLEPKHIVSPGDVITEDTGYMRWGKHNVCPKPFTMFSQLYIYSVYRGRKSKLHCKEKRIIYFYYIFLI